MRSLLVVTLLVVLAGCASPPPSAKTEAWYNNETQRWVDAIIKSCDATHTNFEKGISPVDCFVDFPIDLQMSFPSRPFLASHEKGVTEYLTSWCRAVQARTGASPKFVIFLRQEKIRMDQECSRGGK